MAGQEPPLSSGYRWRLGTTLILLFLSIPAAVLAGSVIGGKLMSDLKQQVNPTLSDAKANGGDSFSPYGVDKATGVPLNNAQPTLDSGTPEPEANPDKTVLDPAPDISVEPVNINGDTAEPLAGSQEAPATDASGNTVPNVDPGATPEPDQQAIEPDAAPGKDSVFNLDGNEAKKPAVYRINLGTFASRENAQSLVDDLKTHGYAPIIEPKKGEGDEATQYRVLIGRYKDAGEAGQVAEELRRLGYNAWLNKL